MTEMTDTIALKKINYETFRGRSPKILLISKASPTPLKMLIHELHVQQPDIVSLLMFGENENDCELFGDIIPPIFIYPDFDKDILHTFCIKQKQLIAKHGKEKGMKSLVIFNNSLNQEDFNNNDDIKWLITNEGINSTVIFRSSYPVGISSYLQSWLDYIFVDTPYSHKDKKIIHENYFRIIPTFQMFNDIIDSASVCQYELSEQSIKIATEILDIVILKDIRKIIMDYFKDNGTGLCINHRAYDANISICVKYYDIYHVESKTNMFNIPTSYQIKQ